MVTWPGNIGQAHLGNLGMVNCRGQRQMEGYICPPLWCERNWGVTTKAILPPNSATSTSVLVASRHQKSSVSTWHERFTLRHILLYMVMLWLPLSQLSPRERTCRRDSDEPKDLQTSKAALKISGFGACLPLSNGRTMVFIKFFVVKNYFLHVLC